MIILPMLMLRHFHFDVFRHDAWLMLIRQPVAHTRQRHAAHYADISPPLIAAMLDYFARCYDAALMLS